ncbi:MAG: GNAT family N-acetyltransferase [Chloroflexi bacterium]|nr:GNAT family N-acetyltransferase [Chloroflexota bacterium]
MITIRDYLESNAKNVGILIADTYGEFNLSFVPPEERIPFLGPFQYARSLDKSHQEAISQVISAPMVLVAQDGDEIVGVLRGGRKDERQRVVLQSLFVKGTHHRRGIGQKLVERFEEACQQQEETVIRVASSPYAVPFYRAMGYKKTTGMRSMKSFDGEGFEYQPMKKVLTR